MNDVSAVPLFEWPPDAPKQPEPDLTTYDLEKSQPFALLSPGLQARIEPPTEPRGPESTLTAAVHVPAVAQAVAVIERALDRLAATETRPLLEQPRQSFRPRQIGGVRMFPVALGTGSFGAATDEEEAVHVLDAFRAGGGNAIDTTDAVADGHPQMVVGKWVTSRRIRDELVLMARVGRDPAVAGLSSTALVRAVDASLARLGTDRIDVLTFHDDDRRVPLEETLAAAESLVRAGKVRVLVAGNYSPERLIEARIVAAQAGVPMFAGVQAPYSLLQRSEFEAKTARVVHAQELGVLARVPLAGGFLADGPQGLAVRRRLRPAHPVRAMIRRGTAGRRGARITEAVLQIAARRDVPTATVALAWLLTKPHMVAPVVSVQLADQVGSVLEAARVHLTRVEANALDAASAG
jgi:aryl-alcohol dehydrogenase-like predicted oxidoreductase